MASHLNIQSGAAGVMRIFGGQQAGAQDATSEPSGLLGLFGALLAKDGVEAKATATATLGETPKLDLASLLAGLDGEETEKDPAEALIGVAEAPKLALPVEPKPMLDFIEALGTLKASLNRGEPLDPELLGRLETSLQGLAEALGLDLETLPVPENFAALLEGAEGDGLAGTLTQLLGPLAQSFASAERDAEVTTDRPALDTQLKALGDKLGALIAALEAGEVPEEKLAALGMPVDGEPAAEIAEAMARFSASLKTEAVPDAPELAVPALKLTESVLTGKSTDAADTNAPAAKPVETSASTAQDTRSDTASRDDRPAPERPDPARAERPATPSPAAVAEAAPPSTSASPASSEASVKSVDAVTTAPRVIQAGYQTSQQQLNLPQIAFELGRQMEGGNTRFQIRLDPPELGRIDVRLEIDQSGQVNARLTVEKAETLDLMQRDQRGLERALQQAGIDSNKTNLEFSLKQNPFAGQGAEGDGKGRDGSGGGQTTGAAADEPEQALPTVNLYRGSLQASGLNIIA